ncbi:MAG: response regulator transcription factor [Planctomycetota bacterium]|nr:response regulator transcription factor [Planctomycetota bacterium]
MATTTAIRVVLADDHAIVRKSLSDWLSRTQDIVVVGEVGDAESAIDSVLAHEADVVVFDIDMPGKLCFDAAKTILSRKPNIKILFLSAFSNDRYIEQALAAQASGYVTKGHPPQTLAEAIRTVAQGGVWFSPEVQARLVIDHGGARLAGEGKTRASLLTPRELEVLGYLARGLSKKEIAGTMHLSVKTVDNHTTSLMAKLDIHDRVELARFAIREGLAVP